MTELNQTQSEILETAANHTKQGGRVVYFTCSILPDENEKVIEQFLQKHRNFSPINLKKLWQQKLNGNYPVSDEFMLHLNPLISGTDGFFVCVLEKN